DQAAHALPPLRPLPALHQRGRPILRTVRPVVTTKLHRRRPARPVVVVDLLRVRRKRPVAVVRGDPAGVDGQAYLRVTIAWIAAAPRATQRPRTSARFRSQTHRKGSPSSP